MKRKYIIEPIDWASLHEKTLKEYLNERAAQGWRLIQIIEYRNFGPKLIWEVGE